MPATTGVGIMTQSQDVNPANSHTREDLFQGMSTSSINIIVPTEVKQLSGLPTILEDLNIADAIAGLVVSRQSGETIQRYKQHHAAAGWYQGSPIPPAFFRQAGEHSEQRTEQVALPKVNMQSEPEEELLIPLPKKKPQMIPMAKKLQNRIAYQRMHNEDMCTKGGSRYADQGIAFSADGKVLDEMKQLYQSSLKSAAAPGDPGDDGDDDSDEPSNSKPWRGDPPPRTPKSNNGDRSHRSGSGKGSACFSGGPPGYPDDGGNGRNGSDEHSHRSHRSNDQDRRSDRNRHQGYSVPAAVHLWYNTPGIMEVVEHHCIHMHEHLLQLI